MKHVEVCEGSPQTFRVFCDMLGKYVLDKATRSQVTDYFIRIATRRANDAAQALLDDALEAGPRNEPRKVH